MSRNRSAGCGWWLAWATLFGLGFAADARELEPPPPGLDVDAIARRADESLYGERTSLVATLSVSEKRSSEPREARFRALYDAATHRSLVRFKEPKGLEDLAFLDLPPNLWTYEPDTERTRRIPRAEFREAWWRSDFIIDDFVRASSLSQDYHHELLGVDSMPDGFVGRRAWVVRYTPRVGSPELWERIHVWIDTEWGTPLRREDYDSEGKLVRITRFGGIRAEQGRNVPMVWIVESPGGGRESRLDVKKVDFSAEFAPESFTTGNLKPGD